MLLKDKNTGVIELALMHIYSAAGNPAENSTYSKRSNDFSGTIFFTDLNGEFINGWMYEDGKIIRKSKKSSTTGIASGEAPISSSIECQTIETMWYERTCNYYYNGDVTCTNW